MRVKLAPTHHPLCSRLDSQEALRRLARHFPPHRLRAHSGTARDGARVLTYHYVTLDTAKPPTKPGECMLIFTRMPPP